MKETFDELCQCIRYHKNGCNDETLTAIVALPIALFVGLFTFPIIIHEYKKAHKESEKEPEAMIFQVDDDTTATKPKKRKKK